MSTAAAAATTTTLFSTLFSTLFLWLFVAVAFNVVNVGFCYGTTRCIPNERKALLEFKKHLKDPSNRLATWAAAADDGDDDDVADCCGWYGVSCHHRDNSTAQYVTGLHLRSLSPFEYQNSFYGGDFDDYKKTLFGGNITSALLSLKHLRYLDLSYNDFGGVRVPSFLGSMGSLRYLNLSEAGFGGMIPHQLGNLSNLQYLDLNNYRYYAYEQYYSYSSYVENLHWLSGLSSLKFLDMGSVNLSKALNWVQEVSTTFPSLLELHLPGCKLPSPQPHLLNIVNASSSSLSILDLSRNKLGQQDSDFDFFFSWVSGFKTLNSLNLEANEFRGSIPRELQNMSSLSELYLGGNRFNSSIPNWLFGHLKVLSLFSNYLSSFQPKSSSSSVDNFSSLSVLDLSNNKFQGPIPNEIQNMTFLQKLDLFGNKFDSSIPNWLYGMTRLEHLDLGGNDLEGKISSAIGNLTSLITLRMTQRLGSKLGLEGGIPMSFKNSCNLKELYLSDVSLKQDINQVFEILSLSGPTCVSNNRLELLPLANCQLFGGLTTTNQNLGRLMSLKILDLSGNRLNGTLPVSLGRLKNLQELGLSGNSLDGEVSEAHFESLTSLQVFAVSGLNQLKLRVSPDWIPPFRRIKYLLLGSWDIRLQFPTWLRSLESLSYLDLSNSGIATTIPVWFWNISSNLIFLDLSHNQIHGTIPSTLLPLISPYSWINLSSNRFHHYLLFLPNWPCWIFQTIHSQAPSPISCVLTTCMMILGRCKF